MLCFTRLTSNLTLVFFSNLRQNNYDNNLMSLKIIWRFGYNQEKHMKNQQINVYLWGKKTKTKNIGEFLRKIILTLF